MAKQVIQQDRWNQGAISQETVHNIGDTPAGVDSAQWNANPYASMSYEQSPWQKLMANFGFRTNYDAYRESLALQAKEYEAGLLEKAHNEQYDSAVAQAQRERAAGINPDLAGNVDAGSSAGLPDDGNPPAVPEGNDFETFSQFGSMMLSGINMAVGLAESGFGLVNMVTDIAGKKLGNDEKKLSVALDAMLSVTSPEDLDNFMSSDSGVMAVNYLPALTEVFGARRAKKYVGAVNKAAQGLKGHQLEASMRNLFAGDWISYHNQTAGGKDAGWSMFGDTMQVLREELSKDFWKNLKENTKLENLKIQDQTAYEQTRLSNGVEPATIAGAQAYNEGRKLGFEADSSYGDWMLKQQQYTMNQSTASVVKRLNDLADNGNWFAGLAAMAIQFIFSRFSVGAGFTHKF